MFQRLQQKWKVDAAQLMLIFFTFAIGGSITGYAGRKLLNVFAIEERWLWIVIYLLLICLLWPLAVLLVSIPFGQFSFFLKYIRKIGKRMGMVRSLESGVQGRESETKLTTHDSRLSKGVLSDITHIAIFASGAGSNAQRIIDHFRNHSTIKVALIVCSNAQAGVLSIAEKENIPSIILDKEKFFRGNGYADELKEYQIDLIVLAGFLWKIPSLLIKAYPGRIINIHPALLPSYGGKNMYGHYVHDAVIANKEKESGISIHFVDELYDHGKLIFQTKCPVLENDTADSLAQRIHALEHTYYPKLIEEIVRKSNKS
jgi:formyltetrahydrofolate-dependent phosphoribosylglycinamide formyltransferase